MVIYENGKRVVSRGITFIENSVLLIERFKKDGDELLHYYTIPGGGVEDNEAYVEAAIRETEEETTVKTKFIKYFPKIHKTTSYHEFDYRGMRAHTIVHIHFYLNTLK